MAILYKCNKCAKIVNGENENDIAVPMIAANTIGGKALYYTGDCAKDGLHLCVPCANQFHSYAMQFFLDPAGAKDES